MILWCDWCATWYLPTIPYNSQNHDSAFSLQIFRVLSKKRRGLEEFTDWYMKYFATAKQVNPGGRTVRTVGGLI